MDARRYYSSNGAHGPAKRGAVTGEAAALERVVNRGARHEGDADVRDRERCCDDRPEALVFVIGEIAGAKRELSTEMRRASFNSLKN